MKLSEIKEIGYYCQVGDTERLNIYEVIKNTDKEWLKEDPKATLLIDTWIYEYKDENDRGVYFADGNLLSVYLDTSTIDVVKIENINYKVFGEYGHYLIEDKPTYKEQLRTAQARVKELEKDIKNLKEEYHIQKTKMQQRYEDLLGFDISELEDLSQEDKNVLDNSTIKSLFNENKDLKHKLKTTEESLKGITQFDINNKCENSEYFIYTDNNIKDDILINLHTKN